MINDRPTQLRVNLDALLNNYRKLNALNNKKIGLAIVKADSYGLGSKVIADYLYKNGVRHFATATLEEAIELKDVIKDSMVLVLGVTNPQNVKYAVENNVSLTCPSKEWLEDIFQQAQSLGVKEIIPSTMGEPLLYKHFARLNDIEYRSVLLNEEFQLNATELLKACDKHTKLVWLCSPNTPSGNLLNVEEVEKVLKGFDGIVIIDEAYADFTRLQTFRERISEFPNIIVLNTFSKAWASAAIRLGVVYAQEAIINIFNKVSSPYHISQLTQEQGLDALKHRYDIEDWIKILLLERKRMILAFESLACCEKVYPSNANFFLAKMKDAQSVYNYLCQKGIKVRNCSNLSLCNNCLRITIGAKAENAEILGILRYYKPTK